MSDCRRKRKGERERDKGTEREREREEREREREIKGQRERKGERPHHITHLSCRQVLCEFSAEYTHKKRKSPNL